MSLFIEFHLIQNFAPSNLNRDDTGAPKDAIFGGYRRARISSQCLKRAVRQTAEFPAGHQGVRTKKLLELLSEQLRTQFGREAEDMPAVGAGAFSLAFGDFKEGYLIADRVGMRITRDEITTPGFVKFYVRKRVGGKIRNSQATKVLKIAAS